MLAPLKEGRKCTPNLRKKKLRILYVPINDTVIPRLTSDTANEFFG